MSDVTATSATSTRGVRGDVAAAAAATGTPSSPIVWAAAVVVTLLDDPGPARPRPVARAPRRHRRSPTLLLGSRGMTHRDLRWAVAYQVVAWSALLGIQWVDPSTQAWLLYFTLFPQLWAMVPTRWAVVGTVLVVTAFAAGALGRSSTSPATASPRSSSPARHLDGRCPCRSGCSSTGSSARPRAAPQTIDELRADPGPARRGRARPRGARGARAHLARDPRHPRAGLHLGGRPLPRGPGRAGARGHRRGAGAARAHRAHGIRQPRRGPADRRRAHARAPAVAHPRGGPRAARRGGDQRDRAARRRAGGRRTRCRSAGRPRSSSCAPPRRRCRTCAGTRRPPGSTSPWPTTTPTRWCSPCATTASASSLDGARSGFGLDGVQARAAEVGGAVQVLSEPGAGTTLRLVVPR